MNWKQYQNELIIVGSLLLMVLAYGYKYNKVNTQAVEAKRTMQSLEELKEVVALKKIWANTKTTDNMKKLQTLMPVAKVKWSQKSKKVAATFTGLTANELNKLTSKILSMPIIIRLLDIEKVGRNYDVEFKCKW